jgi:hypothetical protein
MPTALNLTMKLKQDPASLAKLAALKAAFTDTIQPAIAKALGDSQIVHYARVLVIDDRYVQVITEFDGDAVVYTEFFRVALPDFFSGVFDLVEGAPPWDEINNRDDFFKFAEKLNVRALGVDPTDPKQGFLFSAYPDKTVKQIIAPAAAAAGRGSA